MHVSLSSLLLWIRPIKVLKAEAVIYIHDHLPHSLTSLFFGSNNAWLLHVQSIPTLFPISLCHWIGCLHCLGHLTVLECGGSFLMRWCCLTHRLYSDRSPSFPLICSHFLRFPVTRCSSFSLIHSHFSKSQVNSTFCGSNGSVLIRSPTLPSMEIPGLFTVV